MAFDYDPKQPFQLDAIWAVDSVFEGESEGQEVNVVSDVIAVANALQLTPDQVLANIRDVQRTFALPRAESLELPTRLTIEMETGTGKTYVYFRTIQELSRRRGFKKFVIVAPTIAIREGIESNQNSFIEHFRSIYGHDLGNFRVYDSSNFSLIRQFSVSNDLEILLIGISSFNKSSNLLYSEAEELGYTRPIDLIQACRPVVILDEPQSMGGVGSAGQRSILGLNPLAILGYSATHRELTNLVYSLNPVQAHELGLVKKIDVLSVIGDNIKDAAVEITALDPKKIRGKWGTAQIRGASGASKTVHFGTQSDFFKLSDERNEYAGFVVTAVDFGTSTVRFENGVSLMVGENHGLDLKEKQRLQIELTITEHLQRELFHRTIGLEMKVLTIFFIDAVNRYVEDDGEIRKWFEEAYERISAEDRFADLKLPHTSDVHRGYFSKRRGKDADTSGDTEDDKQTYELIMRNKERLLDAAEPVRFIFSHTALREGWDNPNVFQVCTLNLTKSDVKKRQEIGRGLRLPRNSDGTRCMDPTIARLTVVANESYDDFARQLQQEFIDDCGVVFASTSNRRDLTFVEMAEAWEKNPFLLLAWSQVARKTAYRISIDNDALVEEAAARIGKLDPAHPQRLTVSKAFLELSIEGVVPSVRSLELLPMKSELQKGDVQSVVTALHLMTGLTRSTIARIIESCVNAEKVLAGWHLIADAVAGEIKGAFQHRTVDSIAYNLTGEAIPLEVLGSPLRVDVNKSVVVKKSVCDRVPYQSDVERDFALALDARTDVEFFLKLPIAFTIPTLAGPYTPDWVVVLKREDGSLETVVIETKGSTDGASLREVESIKIHCAKAHFKELGVRYKVVADISGI